MYEAAQSSSCRLFCCSLDAGATCDSASEAHFDAPCMAWAIDQHDPAEFEVFANTKTTRAAISARYQKQAKEKRLDRLLSQK